MMVKKGDMVRFLNATGGGRVTRTEGNMAFVEDSDGFETPALAKDLVVVMPAGYEAKNPGGAGIMFDQSAFDSGRKERDIPASPHIPAESAVMSDLPVVETPDGDSMNLSVAFEPSDLKNLAVSAFSAVFVNDSNYFLDFTYLVSSGNNSWKVSFKGTAGPNELIDLASYTHESLAEIDALCIQYVAYKNGKDFSLKSPGSVMVRPDMTKFYKLHCFRPGRYFDAPVIEIPIIKNDEPVRRQEISPVSVEESMKTDAAVVRQLKEKYRVDTGVKKRKGEPQTVNPAKLLPLIEIDLHINELTDTTAGMDSADMLQMQLDAVRNTMSQHKRRIGQKIVFIHGKGDGVLRKAVLSLLKKEYPKCETQDASFREYGFGATLVTVR